MQLKQLHEASYMRHNAAEWAQQAVNHEYDVYLKVKSWPAVHQRVGTQTQRFDHNTALKQLTQRFGEPKDHNIDYDDEESLFWYIEPESAETEFSLEVGLRDGTVTVWDVVDSDEI